MTSDWPFDDPPETAVVTTRDITDDRLPILEVFHDWDDEDGAIWQSHSGRGDYDPKRLMLVRLETIVQLDPSVLKVASLPQGRRAVRSRATERWRIQDPPDSGKASGRT